MKCCFPNCRRQATSTKQWNFNIVRMYFCCEHLCEFSHLNSHDEDGYNKMILILKKELKRMKLKKDLMKTK